MAACRSRRSSTAARLPASRAALAKIIEPKVAGGRNTTCPSARCGASSAAISCCAKAGAGHRINSASRTASAISVVTSASCTSCRPLASLTTMREPAARCCRHLRRIAPPQPDVVALQREIARRREGAVAAAEHRDLQRASPCADAVKLPQHEMLHLAQRRARQVVDEDDIARHLEAGELGQHMRLQMLPPRPSSRRAG